ncbi:hypothetical protein BDF20DRAFT_825785, partial [Mycotypha africana]|uniref:uncharacterized protein n=1 Tax=Mycotypha africana TaxID=64632 RepID=UPI002300C9D7
VLALVLKSYISPPKNIKNIQKAKHPEVLVFKNYTPLELVPFDGGPYANFAGHDASRGLAKNSFDIEMMSDPNGLIDKLEDLTADEWESLREWENHFASKYLLVGKLLPIELWFRIFQNLCIADLMKCTRVSKSWYNVIYEGTLWTNIDLSKNSHYTCVPNEAIMKFIQSSSKYLKIANLRGCYQLSGRTLRQIALDCPNIHTLILKDCRNISVFSLNQFFRDPQLHLQHLKILDLSGLHTVRNTAFTQWLQPERIDIRKKKPPIEQLNLSYCQFLQFEGIKAIVQACSTTLTHLSLDGVPANHVNDETLKIIGNYLNHHLEYLSLAYCHGITDQGLCMFLQKKDNQTLILSSCQRLTEVTLHLLASTTFDRLQILDISNNSLMADGTGLYRFFQDVNTLTHLNLEGITGLSSSTIHAIGQYQPDLHCLSLSSCSQTTNQNIIYLFQRCQNLQHLELNGCFEITDELIKTLVVTLKTDRNSGVYLEVVDCPHITQHVLKEAVKACPMLSIKSFYSF